MADVLLATRAYLSSPLPRKQGSPGQSQSGPLLQLRARCRLPGGQTSRPSGFGSTLDKERKGAATVAAGVRDANKRTALHFTAWEGRTEVCRFLVEQLRLPIDPKDDNAGGASIDFIFTDKLSCTAYSTALKLWLSTRRTTAASTGGWGRNGTKHGVPQNPDKNPPLM